MGCLHHPWKKCQSTNGFAIGALSKHKSFKLDRITSFNVFFMATYIWLRLEI
jgi:hypothetical protein